MTLPCWTAIFISRFYILWLHILCASLASQKTEIMSDIQPPGTMIFHHLSSCAFELACLRAPCLRAPCLRAPCLRALFYNHDFRFIEDWNIDVSVEVSYSTWSSCVYMCSIRPQSPCWGGNEVHVAARCENPMYPRKSRRRDFREDHKGLYLNSFKR